MTVLRNVIQELKHKVVELADDLDALQVLLKVDVPSSLNKIRFITEKVLQRLCQARGVSWGQAEPTLERMIGPLTAAGCIPKSIVIHVRTIQTNTSPGSHYQDLPLSATHVTIAQSALIEFLQWYYEQSERRPINSEPEKPSTGARRSGERAQATQGEHPAAKSSARTDGGEAPAVPLASRQGDARADRGFSVNAIPGIRGCSVSVVMCSILLVASGLFLSMLRLRPPHDPNSPGGLPFDGPGHHERSIVYSRIPELGPEVGITTNSLNMKLRLVRPGVFQMGSDDHSSEQPIHTVTIRRPFFMAVHKTTQNQFEELMHRNPSHFSPTGEEKDKVLTKEKAEREHKAQYLDTRQFPVETVSYFDAIEFCNELSKKEHFTPCYRLTQVDRDKDGSIRKAQVQLLSDGEGYRLPTEAEREYCAKAGGNRKYPFDDAEDRLTEYAWFGGNSDERPHPVGEKKPNPWGLYDMGGLAWEWCDDAWHENYDGAPADGSPWRPDRQPLRLVVRGGTWSASSFHCRCACRDRFDAHNQLAEIGFRVIRVSVNP